MMLCRGSEIDFQYLQCGVLLSFSEGCHVIYIDILNVTPRLLRAVLNKAATDLNEILLKAVQKKIFPLLQQSVYCYSSSCHSYTQ